MKKMLNLSLIYAIAAMIAGVFYREFTKLNGYTGETMLGKVHAHLFMLGMFMFLIVSLFYKQYELNKEKKFRYFLWFYNIGLILTVSLMVVRGTLQTLQTELSKAEDASISGMAGIGHILTSIGLVLLLLSLRHVVDTSQQKRNR